MKQPDEVQGSTGPRRAPRARPAVTASVAVVVVLLGVTAPRAQVTLWGRNGFWGLSSTVDCLGVRGMGGVQLLMRLQESAIDGTVSGDGGPVPATLEGEVKGKRGNIIKGLFENEACGIGKFKFKLAGDMRVFKGKVRFLGAKGQVTGVYTGDGNDRYDITPKLAFSAAKRGSIKTDKTAVLVAILDNAGPQPLALGIALLRLRFAGEVRVKKVKLLKKGNLARFDFGIDVDSAVPRSELLLPVAVGHATIIAVKIVPPAALAGTTLRVYADFVLDPDSIDRFGPNPPPIPSGMGATEIEVEGGSGLRIRFKLKNKEPSGPNRENIHIFLLDDPDPFSDRTRVPAGKSKTFRVVAQPGQTFSFGAGRGGVIFDTCTTGPAVRSGRGVVEWDPVNYPSFLALSCPGGA